MIADRYSPFLISNGKAFKLQRIKIPPNISNNIWRDFGFKHSKTAHTNIVFLFGELAVYEKKKPIICIKTNYRLCVFTVNKAPSARIKNVQVKAFEKSAYVI